MWSYLINVQYCLVWTEITSILLAVCSACVSSWVRMQDLNYLCEAECVCVCVMLYQWRMFPQVHQVWHEGLFLRYHVWMRSGSSKKSCQITLEVVKLSTFHKDTARQMVISAGSLLWHFHSTMYIYILITAYSLHGLHAVYILRSALRGNAVRSVCN